MFNFLVTQSLRNRLFVLAFAAVLIVYGGFTVTKLPSMCSGSQSADSDHNDGS